MLNHEDIRKLRQHAPSQLREATIQDPPLTDDGWLRVEVDGAPGAIQECPWPWAAAIPSGDDAALVSESDGGNWWVVAWWPNDEPPTPGSGGGGGGTGDVTTAQLNAEEAARIAADNAEAAARAAADNGEATARTNADNAEAAARVAADNLRQLLSEKNQPNGYAGLDGAGKLLAAVLPALAITSVVVAATQAAQLATSAQEGDVVVRSDLNQSYIKNAGTSGTMADWTLLATPGDLVLSVAGKTGAVTLVKADVGLGNVDNTSDVNKPVSTAQAAALALKTDATNGSLATPTLLQARQLSAATALAAPGEIAYDPITGGLRYRDGIRAIDRALSRLYSDTVPSAKAFLVSNLNHANGDLIGFNSKAWDTNGILASPVTNTQTIRAAGKYLINVQVQDNGTATANEQYIILRKNGVDQGDGDFALGTSFARISEIVDCAVGDTITVALASSSLRTLSGDAAGRATHIELIWLGGPGPTVSEAGTPSCALTHSVTQSPASGGTLAFNTVVHDTDGMTATANRVTIKTPGVYDVALVFEGTMSTTSANDWRLVPRKNGVNLGDINLAAGGYSASWSRAVKMAAGDYIDVAIVHSPTGLTINAGERNLLLSVTQQATGKTTIPRARAYRSAALSPAAGWQKIPLDAIEGGLDNDGMFDVANGRLVCKTAGTYLLGSGLSYQSAAGGISRDIGIRVNGVARAEDSRPNASGQPFLLTTGTTWDLAVGDYVELWGYQDTAGALALLLTDNGGNLNWLSAVKVGLSGSGGDNRYGFSDDGAGQVKADSAVRFPNGIVQDAVTAFPFNTANWANQGAPYQTARYYKTPEGEVVLEGLAKVTATMAVGGASARIGTLPAGYAPTATRLFVVYGSQGSNGAQAFVRVAIKSDGTVTVEGAGPAWDGSVNSVVSFDGIRFRP